MCGIWSIIELLYSNHKKNKVDFCKSTINYNDFMELKYRGPDTSTIHTIKNVTIGFHRLAIMDPTFHADQPYIIEDNERTIVFICNGEIYNFKELIKHHELDITNNADCLTIPKLYIKYTKYVSNEITNISAFVDLFINKEIKGEYVFVLFEFDRLQNLKQIIAGRDEIGIRPLYYHYPTEKSKTLIFSSEIKGMKNYDDNVQEFDPGTILNISINTKITTSKYDFKMIYNTPEIIGKAEEFYLEMIRNAVINSVKRRLIADRPIAFLLSGGVDSSLVAAISAKLLSQQINTFCCGMNEGTDLIFARKVAKHIGSNHKEVTFTPEEGLNTIKDVIYTTETWDTTTVRASIGQYIVCKHIGTKTEAKVVMVGEGPDEVCSSYLFNYYAPDGEELHKVSKELVNKIHLFDGRRADRCISHWGLEGRIALLDPEFIEAYWSIPAEWRMPTYKGIEKWWLRKAFDGTNILPDEVLWRKKEAFSDGVSGKNKSWFEIIQEHIKTKVSQDEFLNNKLNTPICAPTLEAYYYKKIFIDFFGEKRLDILPHYWQPKWINKNDEYIDPSARILNVYTK